MHIQSTSSNHLSSQKCQPAARDMAGDQTRLTSKGDNIVSPESKGQLISRVDVPDSRLASSTNSILPTPHSSPAATSKGDTSQKILSLEPIMNIQPISRYFSNSHKCQPAVRDMAGGQTRLASKGDTIVSPESEGQLVSRVDVPDIRLASSTNRKLQPQYKSPPHYQWSLAARIRNNLKRSTNGNIHSNVNIIHWNSGNKKWVNKRNEISQILMDLKPDIMFVSEANIFVEDQDHEICIPGYELLTSNSLETLGYTRMAALIKDKINVEIQTQWMCQNVASIWLKLCKQGGKKIFICGIYMEHKLLRQPPPNETDSEIEQTNRWTQFIQQWTTASRSGDVIVIGDTNLDELKWAAPEYININMVNLVKFEIETLGFQQLIQGPTRFGSQQSDSLIDKCWTNCPDRVMSTENILNGTTDHNIIKMVLRIKGKISTPIEILRRSLKNWDTNNYKKEIGEINWSKMYEQTNVSVAYSHFETEVLKVLNKAAPLSKIQI